MWEEEEAGDKKVVIPPVDSGRPPPADRMAIRLDAQEPARRKHLQKHAESTCFASKRFSHLRTFAQPHTITCSAKTR